MKILKIYLKNLKNIIKSPAALIIIGGLCIVPSFYAWITLKANWDPYMNTGNVPVAIVNNDKGVILNNNIVNFGDDVVSELKKNKDIKWTFVGGDVAKEGVKSGEYYAEIQIPSDFSKDLESISTGSPVKPNLIYTVNEKTNAIAVKITDLASAHLEEAIKESFVKSVNLTLVKTGNNLSENIKKNEPMILKLKEILNSTDKSIGKIQGNLSSSSENINSLNSYLSEIQNNIPNITSGINSLKNALDASENLSMITKNSVNNMANNIASNNSNLQSGLSETSNYLTTIKALSNNVAENKSIILDKLNKAISVNNNILNIMNINKKALNALGNLTGGSVLNNLANSIDTSKIEKEIASLENLKNLINSDKNTNEINGLIDNIIEVNGAVSNAVNTLISNYNTSGTQSVNNINNVFNEGIGTINSTLNIVSSMVPQINSISNMGIKAGGETTSKINELNGKLNSLQKTIGELKEKTGAINGEKLNNVVNMLNKNPETFSNFLSSPVSIQVENLYGMTVFGVGLAPFYTVLAIWVGALLCTSLLTVNDEEEVDSKKGTLLKIHFGKMLLFLTINFIQATIVTLGDVYLIGVKPYSIWLLLGFAWISSIVFTVIIYTLVSIFGNLGKAMAIVIMVLQVAGSGAIYPIQVNPEFFQKLEFAWPFTYSIDGFRQAIGGPDISKTLFDIKILLVFLVVFLLLGILKPLFYEKGKKIEHLFRESGL